MSKQVFELLTNPELIAINQDKLGVQGHKIKTEQPKEDGNDDYLKDGNILLVKDCTGGNEQKWSVNNDGSITSLGSNFCIDIPNCNNGWAQIDIFSCHLGDRHSCSESKNQMWELKSDGGIASKMNNYCLDVYDHHGPFVQTFPCTGGSNQK
jgi:hypothetical protein